MNDSEGKQRQSWVEREGPGRLKEWEAVQIKRPSDGRHP